MRNSVFKKKFLFILLILFFQNRSIAQSMREVALSSGDFYSIGPGAFASNPAGAFVSKSAQPHSCLYLYPRVDTWPGIYFDIGGIPPTLTSDGVKMTIVSDVCNAGNYGESIYVSGHNFTISLLGFSKIDTGGIYEDSALGWPPTLICSNGIVIQAGDIVQTGGSISCRYVSTPSRAEVTVTNMSVLVNDFDIQLGQVRTDSELFEYDSKDGQPIFFVGEKIQLNVPIVSSNDWYTNEELASSVSVTLKIGTKVIETKTVAISEIILNENRTINVPFAFKLDNSYLDQKTLTVEAISSASEVNMSNNIYSQPIHVRYKECKVSEIKNKPVKFFSQGGGHWGNQDYAHGPANNQTTCKMKSFGCVTTSLAMLFDFYGLNYVAPEINGPTEEFSPGYLNRLFKSTKDLNNQVLDKTYSYSPNNQLTHNNVEPLLVPNIGRSIYSKKCYDEEKQKPGFKDTIAKATCINKSSRKISFIEKPNEWQTTPTNLNQAAKDAGFKKIETEICNGNPVLLRVAREAVNTTTGRLELRKHTVLVTESFYDEDEKLSFVVNDPSITDKRFAENQKLSDIATRDAKIGKQYKHVIGYTVYRQTADPTMISIFSSPNVDFILTDKLGRRAGFSPISNTFYSEIPNSSYINESIDNADDEPLAEANRPNQNNLIITEDVQDGEYQITLFGKDSGIADLQITKTDFAGFINDTEAFSSPVSSGSTQIFKFNHTSAPLPIVHDNLVINYAQYELARTPDQYNSNSLDKPWQEIKPDKIKIYGDVKLPMGLKATCADSFTFKVGPSNEFNQTLNLRIFKQKSLSGNLFYEYSTDDLKIVVSESGLFWIEIKRIDLDSINASKWGQIYVGLNNNLGRVDLNLNCKDRICYGEEIK